MDALFDARPRCDRCSKPLEGKPVWEMNEDGTWGGRYCPLCIRILLEAAVAHGVRLPVRQLP